MSSPRISVIIPTYNGEKTIAEAIASVRGEGDDIEVVVVNDGSTDRTVDILASISGITVVHQQNAGPSVARNTGLDHATGSRIAFLDDDDLAMENRLATLSVMLDDEPSALVALGRSVFRVENEEESRPPEPLLMYHLGAALFRREYFERFGRFDPALRTSQDIDLFLRGLDAGERFAVTSKLVQTIRRNGENTTAGRSLRDLGFMSVLKRSLDRRRGATP
ncbi:MAG TPA: glycosyltransferase family A protein [Thermoanaerobaculia bacterium]